MRNPMRSIAHLAQHADRSWDARGQYSSLHEKADPCQELVLFFLVRVFALSMIFSISVPFSQAT
jgi:hypothetical protein